MSSDSIAMKRPSHYYCIDGLRTIGALGIILMHISINSDYQISGILYNVVIAKLGILVRLFFIISGFAMCAGYYEKVKANELNLNKFFTRRLAKIFPFFLILVLIELVMNWQGTSTLYEAFADLTLLFGFLPNSNITVIGVGWALGVIFAFYCLFPYFVFLIWNKKRAWFTFILCFGINYACEHYFLSDGKALDCNLLRWLVYFVAGGLIYLYKDEVLKRILPHRFSLLALSFLATILWFIVPTHLGTLDIRVLRNIVVFSLWLIYAISFESKVLNNPVTRFISDISMEIYLAHMLIFRALQKLNLLHLMENDVASYLIVCVLTIAGVIVFSLVLRKVLERCARINIARLHKALPETIKN